LEAENTRRKEAQSQAIQIAHTAFQMSWTCKAVLQKDPEQWHCVRDHDALNRLKREEKDWSRDEAKISEGFFFLSKR